MSDVRDKNHSSVKKCEGYNFSKRLIPVRCDRLQTMFLYWEKLIWGEIEILLMTNNDNCIRTLLNTSLASKSPKIFPMGHTRESLDIHIFTPIYLHGFEDLHILVRGQGRIELGGNCPKLNRKIFILSENINRLVADCVLSHKRFSLI